MLSASYESFKWFAIMVPRAEAPLTALPQSRETSIQAALVIGFLALMLITGILFSDAPPETKRRDLAKPDP